MIWTPALKTPPDRRRAYAGLRVAVRPAPRPVGAPALGAMLAALIVLALVAALALRPAPAHANGIGTIFVANERSNNVSVIEHVSNTVLANIQVGNGPHAVSFTRDGRFALVANRSAGSLSIIDRDAYQTSATVRVGGSAEDVDSPADTTFSIVADGAASQLSIVDSAGATIRNIATPAKPISIATDRGARRTYVVMAGSESLAVFDATSG